VDYNKVLKQYDKLINFYSYSYCKDDKDEKNGFDDFKQTLMISLWEYIDRKYDSNKGNIDGFVKGNIKYLALQLATKVKRNKQLKFENSFISLDDCFYHISDNIEETNLPEVIETYLTDMQKKIVYAIDFKMIGKNLSYSSIAKSLGISSRMVYYYLLQIRDILEKYVKYK
jgi:DNA-directed RNA polymerase specialized sigma24 family protein